MTQNQQFQPELPENEALFRSMIEGLAEGVIIADLEEVALYWVVSQKQESDKVGKLKTPNRLFHVYSLSI